MISAVSPGEVEFVSNVEFSLRDDEAKTLAAYKAAAENAKKKAEILSSTLGAKIVRVLYIEDQSKQTRFRYSSGFIVSYAVTQVPAGDRSPRYLFPPQQFEVESDVRVRFEIGMR